MERTRVVDHVTIVGEPVSFRELCERAVPATTRLVVFDLDRTLHLGRNMGELLGWEICAYLAYGDEYLAELEPRRTGGRVYLARERPKKMPRYMRIALQHWGTLGLFYLLWGKLGSVVPPLRRRSFLRFGPEPVRAIQRYAQHALFHRISALPLHTVRELAGRVWNRYAPDQTVERADVEWLRQRCPGVKIVISSASPQPVLETAARELGVDDIIYSSLEEHDGRLSAPPDRTRLSVPERAPHRITPPSKARINAGRGKLDELFARYPELREVESVGISDTGYGEDHCWADAFSTLIDVNSTTPFPPIVPAGARVHHIVSAGLLTRREKAERTAGRAGFLDSRRRGAGVDRELTGEELRRRLAAVHASIEALASQLDEHEQALRPAREAHAAEESRRVSIIERVIETFNGSEGAERESALAELGHELAEGMAAVRRLTRLERPISLLAFSLTRELERARRIVAV